ncbi:hypothetical protein [Streptomyces sp. NPDC005525]|uniref:hypothetical protein n=1 Tax=Streptomyces sp. NPDC005525 TaxID=3364720 RepID=UPI003680396F
MTHTEAAAALENAKFDRRQDLRHEESADDGGRGEAEFAEWERITQLLAATGGAYDPGADAVVQDELAVEAAAAEAREAEQLRLQQLADRADEIERLVQEDVLAGTEPREGDEAARHEIARRSGWQTPDAVDGWLAHALAAHLGHYADPAARTVAADLLPAEVSVHAALLSALAHLAPAADVEILEFAARLAQAGPHATAQLAELLAQAVAAEAGASGDRGDSRCATSQVPDHLGGT